MSPAGPISLLANESRKRTYGYQPRRKATDLSLLGPDVCFRTYPALPDHFPVLPTDPGVLLILANTNFTHDCNRLDNNAGNALGYRSLRRMEDQKNQ